MSESPTPICEMPVPELYAAHKAVCAAMSAMIGDCENEAWERLFRLSAEIEKALFEAPSQTATDVAQKILTMRLFTGETIGTTHDAAFWSDVERLAEGRAA